MEIISKSDQIKNALINETLVENDIKEEWAISWLNPEKACFLVQTKININDKWVNVGDSEIIEIIEFKNTEESLKLLKSSVPEPYLSAVLTVWETPT